jgi:exosortase
MDHITAVILAGSRDFGRCPIASRLPTALWPVAGQSVLERLLCHLRRQGLTRAVICSYGDSALLQASLPAIKDMRLSYLDKPLPLGTAGSMRDAAIGDARSTLLVFHASIVSPPPLSELLDRHRCSQADLTVALNPESARGDWEGDAAGVYLCEPAVLPFIPQEGYCDIKETLIPALAKAQRKVQALRLSEPLGNFRDWQGYLRAMADFLRRTSSLILPDLEMPPAAHDNIWIHDKARVHPTARIYGPALIMPDAEIAAHALVFGPAIIGNRVKIAENALVLSSVIWDGASIEKHAQLHRCLVDFRGRVAPGDILEDQAFVNAALTTPTPVVKPEFTPNADVPHVAPGPLPAPVPSQIPDSRLQRLRNNTLAVWSALAILLLTLLWSYGDIVLRLWSVWMRNDEYSSGLLVPFLAAYVAWSRRRQIAGCVIQPSLWGLLFFLAAQALRGFGLIYMYSSAENLSLVLTIAALVLWLFGWTFFRTVTPILLFLFLMLPWPHQVQDLLSLRLQESATLSATYCLQTLGYSAVREGNIINLGGVTVAVAEACNGLRMLTAFLVIAGWVVLLVRRTWWEKIIILLSSLPIGLFCNTVRLTLTAVAFTFLDGPRWEKVFHDFGGYAMMPLALSLIVLELWFLSRLTLVPVENNEPLTTRQNHPDGLPRSKGSV